MRVKGQTVEGGPVILAERRRGPFEAVAAVSADGLLVVLELSGELDLGTVGILRTAIAGSAPGAALVVDLRRLDFIDSSGLGLLIDTYVACRTTRRRFALVAGPPAVHRAFEISGLHAVLPFVTAPEDVL